MKSRKVKVAVLDRGPDGRFCGPGGALVEWLPYLLGYPLYEPLRAALGAMAKWCMRNAAGEYESIADFLRLKGTEFYATNREVEAHRWFKRAAILEKAEEDLQRIPGLSRIYRKCRVCGLKQSADWYEVRPTWGNV